MLVLAQLSRTCVCQQVLGHTSAINKNTHFCVTHLMLLHTVTFQGVRTNMNPCYLSFARTTPVSAERQCVSCLQTYSLCPLLYGGLRLSRMTGQSLSAHGQALLP